MDRFDVERKYDWRGAVSGAAGAIRSGRITRGELAELRRMRPREVPPAAFWHVLVRFVEPYDSPPNQDFYRQKWEEQWAVILGGMARLDHETGRSLGRTLAETGFHELRLRRLLRASGERLWDELRAAVQFLASKGTSIDWREAAELVRFDPTHKPERGSSIRRRIARAFFAVQP